MASCWATRWKGVSIWRTEDSGEHWTRDASPALAAQDGEGAFAASNSSLALAPGGEIYFGTGGKSGARIFRYDEHFKLWSASRVPLAGGRDAAGVFSLQFRDSLHGVAVGGDYERAQETARTAAWTSDGGRTWQAATRLPGGYRSAVAWDETERVWVAAGPNGTDVSADDGKTWKPFDKAGWNALSLPWAAGANGMIAQVNSNALQRAARE